MLQLFSVRISTPWPRLSNTAHCTAFIGYQCDDKYPSSPLWLCGSMSVALLWHTTRALCPSGGYPWLLTTTVGVKSLHSTACSSDLYRTVKLCVQRTCGVEQSAISLAWAFVTDYIYDDTENVSFQTVTKTTWHCCGVSWFWRRDVNDYIYLLTLSQEKALDISWTRHHSARVFHQRRSKLPSKSGSGKVILVDLSALLALYLCFWPFACIHV